MFIDRSKFRQGFQLDFVGKFRVALLLDPPVGQHVVVRIRKQVYQRPRHAPVDWPVALFLFTNLNPESFQALGVLGGQGIRSY